MILKIGYSDEFRFLRKKMSVKQICALYIALLTLTYIGIG